MNVALLLTLLLSAAPGVAPPSDVSQFAIGRLTEWFGPYGSATEPVDMRVPWLATSRGMERAAEIVRAIARQWWGDRVRFADADRALRDGLVWYLQSRIVEDLFDRRWELRAYALDVRRFFGGAVPWELRTIAVSRNTVGVARDVYLGRPQSRWRATMTPEAARVALGFASLEQRFTWPVLERGLRSLALQHEGHTIDRRAFGDTLSRALGTDVAGWLALASGHQEVNASVTRVAAEPCVPSPCVRTIADLRATGDPTGEWPVRVRFADGRALMTSWRPSQGTTVWFESAVPPADVTVDPDRTNLLDRDYRDNTLAVTPSTNVRIDKWGARWLVWLQQIMLTYTITL
jgi:hypothetical protein